MALEVPSTLVSSSEGRCQLRRVSRRAGIKGDIRAVMYQTSKLRGRNGAKEDLCAVGLKLAPVFTLLTFFAAFGTFSRYNVDYTIHVSSS